jgi:hypothetical protein
VDNKPKDKITASIWVGKVGRKDAVEDEDHLLLVCPAHHDIPCKFGQQLGKQLTPCSLLPELMHSANQKAVALYLVSCLDYRSVLLKPTR